MASTPIAGPFRRHRNLLLCTSLCLLPIAGGAEPVVVRAPERSLQVTLALRASDGSLLADGTLDQNVAADRVTSRLTFRFKDGSLQDQTTVFSQQGRFLLISDRLVQKGPAFNTPVEMSIDAKSGRVNEEHLQMPADLANGMLPVLLKNLDPNGPAVTVSFVATTPRPRLVGLRISRAGVESLALGGVTHRAIHYVVKAEIGGVAGVFAPLVGKQPPDTHVWILSGDAPAFLKSEGPLFYGGAAWRIEVTSPLP